MQRRWATAVLLALAIGLTAFTAALNSPRPADATPRAGAGGGFRAAPGGLATGIVVPEVGNEPQKTFQLVRQTGSHVARLIVSWAAVTRKRPPTRAQAREWTFAGYEWADVDAVVHAALAAGVQPLLSVTSPPTWAQRTPNRAEGPWYIDARAFGDFAHAAAARYDGSSTRRPRVRLWMAWNEPNLSYFLNPQTVKGRLEGARLYRGMVNAFADGVHAVHRDNLVVAGGLAPFTRLEAEFHGVAPLAFMRSFLCLSKKLRPTCRDRATFDAWSHHPYTSGGPTRHAYRTDDVSLGDLPEMRAVLDAGYRQGRIRSARRPLFWVTEFSWDSKPPDPRGVPAALHARWVSEALYRMWRSGVSLVTWFTLQDQPITAPFQSGLYYRGAGGAYVPKPAFEAFRFRFVAFRERGRLSIWAERRGERVCVSSSNSGWGRPGACVGRYGRARSASSQPDCRS